MFVFFVFVLCVFLSLVASSSNTDIISPFSMAADLQESHMNNKKNSRLIALGVTFSFFFFSSERDCGVRFDKNVQCDPVLFGYHFEKTPCQTKYFGL